MTHASAMTVDLMFPPDSCPSCYGVGWTWEDGESPSESVKVPCHQCACPECGGFLLSDESCPNCVEVEPMNERTT